MSHLSPDQRDAFARDGYLLVPGGVGPGLLARLRGVIDLADGRSLQVTIYQDFFAAWAGELNGSLAYALATVLVWWLLLYALYRRGITIRI